MRVVPLIITLLVLHGFFTMTWAQEPVDPMATNREALVATVGEGSVSLGQVLTSWGPAWHEVRAQVMAGKLSAAEADARLQKAWQKAIEGQVREQLFYQESERDAEITFQRYVDRILKAQKAGRGPRKMRITIEKELRTAQKSQIEAAVRNMVEQQVRAAGGFENLRTLLERRGIGYNAWRAELVRKGWTMQYLQQRIDPFQRYRARPKDVLEYYNNHPDEFTIPGAVTFRHILFANDKRGGEDGAYQAATSVWRALKAGKIRFEDAAKTHSDDARSKPQGGLETSESTDPVREAWLSDVREAIRQETPGTLSPILLSSRGAHLAILIEAKPGKKIPIKIAQESIVKRIIDERWEEKSNQLYEQIKSKTPVRILMPRFPPKYALSNLPRGMLPTRRIGVGTESIDESDQKSGPVMRFRQ